MKIRTGFEIGIVRRRGGRTDAARVVGLARAAGFAVVVAAYFGGPRVASADEPFLDRALLPVPGARDDAVREALRKGDTARALDLVREEIGARDSAAVPGELRVLEGRLLLRLGDRDGAQAALEPAMNDSAWGTEALTDLVHIALGRGDFLLAEARLETAPPEASTAVDFARAQIAFVRGDLAAAESALARASRPESGAIASESARRVLRAHLALARGRAPEALALYDEVLGASPDDRTAAIAHYGKARVYALVGAPASRAREAERALELSPFPAASWDAGVAFRALRRRDEARRHLVRAAQGDSPCASPARLAIASLERDGGRREAERDALAGVLAGELADAFALVRLGEWFRSAGRTEEGDELLQSAVEAFGSFEAIGARRTTDAPPDSVERAVAEKIFDGELEVERVAADPNALALANPRRLLVATLRHLGGDDVGALAWTENADPTTPGLLLIRALSLEHIGRSQDALAAFDALSAAGQGSWLVEEHRARLQPAGDLAAFDAIVTPLLEARPRDARLRIRIAGLREKNGDLAGAIDLLRAARDDGWLTVKERQELRDRLADLEDLAGGSPDRNRASPPDAAQPPSNQESRTNEAAGAGRRGARRERRRRAHRREVVELRGIEPLTP